SSATPFALRRGVSASTFRPRFGRAEHDNFRPGEERCCPPALALSVRRHCPPPAALWPALPASCCALPPARPASPAPAEEPPAEEPLAAPIHPSPRSTASTRSPINWSASTRRPA